MSNGHMEYTFPKMKVIKNEWNSFVRGYAKLEISFYLRMYSLVLGTLCYIIYVLLLQTCVCCSY